MPAALPPPDEFARLAALRAHRILDSPPESAFDDLTRRAAAICETPMALVSLVDEKRQWFKSRLGLAANETPRDQSICAHALLTPDQPLIVPDTLADPRFADNPAVTGDPNLRFYAGVPLRSPEGYALGTLCVLDRIPRQLSAAQIEGLRDTAQQIAIRVSVRRRAPAERPLAVGFGIGFALLLGMALFSALQASRFLSSDQWVTHTHQTIRNIEEVLLKVEIAESSQRGYTITGDAVFLTPYQAAVAAMPSRLDSLRQDFSDDPVQRNRCERFKAAIDAKLAIMQERVEQRRTLGEAALENRYRTGRGRVAMESVAAIGQGMIAVENRLLQERVTARTSGLHTSVAVLIVTSIAGSISLAFGCWLVRRELRQNHALGGALAQANAGLANEVAERRQAEGRLSVQHAVAHIAAGNVSLAAAAPQFLQSIAANLGWQFGEWWTVDPATKRLRLASRWYDGAEVSQTSARAGEFARVSNDWTFAKGEGIPGKTWQSEAARWEHDLTNSRDFLRTEAARQAGFHRVFAFPLRGGNQGEFSSVMVFLSDEQGTPDPELVAVMEMLSSQITQFAERCRFEESLRASQARFSAFIENAPAVAYIKDAEGRMLYGNETLLRQFGIAREDWLGKRDVDFWPEAALAIRQNDLAVLAGEHAIESKETVALPDGRASHWLSYKFPLRDETTGDKLLAGISIDITAREEAEENRRAREEAVRASQAKSQFLSRVSHELRTPLNAILGFGQLLGLSPLKGRDAEGLAYILKAGKHLLALVDDVLDFSRAESGDLHLVPRAVNADLVAHDCVALVTHLAEARHLTCQVQTDDPGASVFCDEQRLRQVLINLLTNAIKYNREGGQVIIRCARAGDGRLRFSVEDTGFGISETNLTRLFVPFERLEQAGNAVEGVGLGLVVSCRMTEAMGGSLSVESHVGRGSTFSVELPEAAGGCAVASSLELDIGFLADDAPARLPAQDAFAEVPERS